MNDLFSEEFPPIASARAYTHVDRAWARVGNRWCERVWSSFLGTTTSLVQKAGEVEWAAAESPEFRATVEEVELGPMELGEVEWSEECDGLGATLAMERRACGIALSVRTLALHDNPALMREVRITNLGEREVLLGSCTVDSLNYEGGVSFRVNSFSNTVDRGEIGDDELIAVVNPKGEGLLVGRSGDGVFVFDDAGGCNCATVSRGGGVLAPNDTLVVGRSYLLPFQDDACAARELWLPDLLRRVQLHEMERQARADDDS